MAPKKKAAPSAPASSKPVLKHDGTPTRRAKKEVNKAVFAETKAQTNALLNAAKNKAKKDVEARTAERPVVLIPAKATGRPRDYAQIEWSNELGEDLYVLMSTGHSMEATSKVDGMPSLFQMIRWLADKSHPFNEIRARALENLVPYYEELAKDIALTNNNAEIKTRKQVVTKDGDIVWVTEKRYVDNVERSKLAVQTLQWTLGHLMPKKHGRNPDLTGEKPNAQLEGLFAALKAGPKE